MINYIWRFNDCTVYEIDDEQYTTVVFNVVAKRDGVEVHQTVVPQFTKDVDVCRERLDEGYSPIEDGWSDGFGNAVCLENMEEFDIPEDHVLYKGEVMDIDEYLARVEREAYDSYEE